MINVAILGYGTVGGGVADVIDFHQELITKRVGEEVAVKRILDLRDFPGDRCEAKITHDYEDILNDDSISIVCETMGGVEPAYTFSKKALMKGKSVCTSNKELVATHGPELLQLAAENKCNYFFEASVGGGIPIIRPINEAITAESIKCIQGILNGTTNFILTKMEDEGADFAEVLKIAQDLGYAERNPEADVEGYDACRKIAILASLMSTKTVNYEDVYTEGITKITPADFEYAKKLGMTIKLIGVCKDDNGSILAMVSPRMISNTNPLYAVKDVYNAVLVSSDNLGNTMYYGKGAGKMPTASAVVGDVIEAARLKETKAWILWDAENAKMSPVKEFASRFFVRVKGSDTSKVEEVFKNVNIIKLDNHADEFAFITENSISEAECEKMLAAVDGVITRIRLECEID